MNDEKILKLIRSPLKEDRFIAAALLGSYRKREVIKFFNKYGDKEYSDYLAKWIHNGYHSLEDNYLMVFKYFCIGVGNVGMVVTSYSESASWSNIIEPTEVTQTTL